MLAPPLMWARQVGLDEAAALQRMTAAAPALLRWLATYMNPVPGPNALLDVGYGAGGLPQLPMCFQVRHAWQDRHVDSSWMARNLVSAWSLRTVAGSQT